MLYVLPDLQPLRTGFKYGNHHLAWRVLKMCIRDREVHQRLRELQAYKLPSQEKEVYRHLLERGERMYSESIGEKRMRIAALLEEFEAALQQEQPQHIREVFRRVKSALDEWEADAVSFFS